MGPAADFRVILARMDHRPMKPSFPAAALAALRTNTSARAVTIGHKPGPTAVKPDPRAWPSRRNGGPKPAIHAFVCATERPGCRPPPASDASRPQSFRFVSEPVA